MILLRTLVIVLLLANLLFLLAGRGLFGGSSGGEPARLAAQIDPQKIRVVAVGEAPKPPPPAEPALATGDLPTVPRPPEQKAAEDKAQSPAESERCVAVTGLTAAQIGALKAKLGAEGAMKLRDRSLEGSSWWVNLPPLADRDSAVKRAEEVRAQGVAGAFVIREDGEHRNAVSLGLFKSEAAAEEFLRQLQAKGVSGARISARPPSGARQAIDLRGPASRVDELVELALAANAAARRARCSER